MGGTYAAGWPWIKLMEACGPLHGAKHEAADWFAAMTGRRGHSRHHGFGGPWAMFGGGDFMTPPPWSQRGPKARRGDVRAAILAVLAEQPMNGYQIIQEIAERSGGVWKPSPGSIYPTLQQLEDEGLVSADAESGRRTFSLTDEGRTYVGEHADEVAAPWAAMSAGADQDESGFKPLIGQTAAAMWQILSTGTPEQQARARDAINELRRTLYGILAEDEPDQDRS